MIENLFRDATEVIQSHAERLRLFDAVNGHEPKAAPGNGITCSIWVAGFRPTQSGGLASTTMVLTFNVRLYTSMLTDPQDMIDPNLMTAVEKLVGSLSADFTLDGMESVRCIDLLGMDSEGLGGEAGYLEIDKKMFRVFTITVPLLINDAFPQVA